MILDMEINYLPDRVLDFTEGKTALICGGQKGMEDLRQTLEKVFELKSLDWAYEERGKSGAYVNARHRILQGRYDFVVTCTRFIGHHVEDILVPAARERKIPYIRVPSSFNPDAISRAIDDQVAKRAAEKRAA